MSISDYTDAELKDEIELSDIDDFGFTTDELDIINSKFTNVIIGSPEYFLYEKLQAAYAHAK